MDYELNLTGSITEADFQQALEDYNADHTVEFQLSGSGQEYSLIGGDDIYCEGDLVRVAYFWEGYISGQADGDSFIDEYTDD